MDKNPMFISHAEAMRIKQALRDKMSTLISNKGNTSSSNGASQFHQLENDCLIEKNQDKSDPVTDRTHALLHAKNGCLNIPSTSKWSDSWKTLITETFSSDSQKSEPEPTDFNSSQKVKSDCEKHKGVSEVPSVNLKNQNAGKIAIEKHHWRNFVIHLVSVQANRNFYSLFIHEDVMVFNEFTNLPSGAQKLYIRLLSENNCWHRVSSLKFCEIDCDLNPLIDVLVEKHFLTDVFDEDMSLLIELMTLPELKTVCKSFCLRIDGNKATLVKSLIEFSQNQNISCGVAQDIKIVLKDKVVASLGRIVKLSDQVRKLFLRTMLLYSLPLSRAMELDGRIPMLNIMSRVSAEEIIYPNYTLKPQQNFFASRKSLISFQDALELEAFIKRRVMNKNFEEVVNLSDLSMSLFLGEIGNKETREEDAKLPLCLRIFTAGTVLARAINCSMEGLRTKRMYTKMILAYEILLNQEIYLPNWRGKWYYQLALIYHQYMKDIPKTVDFLMEALTDSSLTAIDRVILSNRGLLVVKRKKRNKAEAEKYERLASMLNCVEDPPELIIQARCFRSKIGGETQVSYIYETEEGIGQILSSVKEIVMLHHRQMGYDHGICAGNAVSMSIFGIFFWDIIYHVDIPNVFICSIQSYPLDLKSGEFYSNREGQIKQRISEIKGLWSDEEMINHIKGIWSQEYGKESVVYWKSFEDFKQFQMLVEFIGRKVISTICFRMAKDFPTAKEGFPDILLWNETTKKCKFIEIKCPGKQLCPYKSFWMAYLCTADADASVCSVNVTGEKSGKRKHDVADNTDPLMSWN